jgi:hypothetical protein
VKETEGGKLEKFMKLIRDLGKVEEHAPFDVMRKDAELWTRSKMKLTNRAAELRFRLKPSGKTWQIDELSIRLKMKG